MIKKTVRFFHFESGRDGAVRLSCLLRRLQELAGDDLYQIGYSCDDLRRKGLAFLLSDMTVEIKEPLLPGVDYTVATAPGQIKGVVFYRSFCITRGKTVAASCLSKWFLCDLINRKIARPNVIGNEFPTNENLSQIEDVERLRLPQDLSSVKTQERTVRPTMLDENGHLNNCVYADLAADIIPEKSTVRRYSVRFASEALLDSVLLVSRFDAPDAIYIQGRFSDTGEICFLSKCEF